MRFVFAIVAFVLAALSMGLGIAERTILAGPDQVTASTTQKITTPVVVIDGSALGAYPHTQTVHLSGASKYFASYGRTSDIVAWIGSTSYTTVTFNAKTGELATKVHDGSATTVPDPSASDLWVGQFTGSSAEEFRLNAPSGISVMAISNGSAPAPSKVSITWPIDNTSPIAGPLITGGGVMLLIGLALLLWALTHMRRTRGPRRNQPKMPKLPRQPRYKPSRQAITARKGRRAINRFVALAPGMLVAGLLLAGCTMAPTPVVAPSSSSTAVPGAPKLPVPAVTSEQLAMIVNRISGVVAQADTNLDPTLIGTRLAGPALADRMANYTVRKRDPKILPSIDIPGGPIRLTLPQQSDTWPRTVLTVVEDKSNAANAGGYVALVLVQDDPRSNYKVNYAITLQPKAVLPEVAPASVGAARFLPDNKLLMLSPNQLALAYGDILMKDTASSSYALFQSEGDDFRQQVGLTFKEAQKKKLPSTARLTYADENGIGDTVALATLNSGAIVAVDLNEIETVRPVKAGAAVSATGAIKALSGKASSTKGLVATYGDQLLFYVPSASVGGKIVLLGYSQGLIDATEYTK